MATNIIGSEGHYWCWGWQNIRLDFPDSLKICILGEGLYLVLLVTENWMANCSVIQFSRFLVPWLPTASNKKPESDTLKSWDLKKKSIFWFLFIHLLCFKPLEFPSLSSRESWSSFLSHLTARTGDFSKAAPVIMSHVGQHRAICFFTSSRNCCIQNPDKGRRMEGQLKAKGEDSMLPLTVGRHSGNVPSFQKLLELPLRWSLDLSFYLYWILTNDKTMPQINVLYATIIERSYAGNMIN